MKLMKLMKTTGRTNEMKKSNIKVILASILLLALSLSLASCSFPPELSEIRADIVTLMDKSVEINEILFGEGLAVEKRMESPFANYECVAFETGYFSVQDIKDAAEEVYTLEYLTQIYEVTFTGKYDSISGSIVRAKYTDSDGMLLKYKVEESETGKVSANNTVFLKGEPRTYDYTTLKIINPSRADYVTFTVMSEKDGVKSEITLAIQLTAKGWRLDYPTY